MLVALLMMSWSALRCFARASLLRRQVNGAGDVLIRMWR